MKPFKQFNSFTNFPTSEISFANSLPSLEERQQFASLFGFQFEGLPGQDSSESVSYYQDYCKLYFASIFYVSQVLICANIVESIGG